MQHRRSGSVLGPRYEMLKRDLAECALVEARTWDDEGGFQIVLTFPETGGTDEYERFKSRLARVLLGQGGN